MTQKFRVYGRIIGMFSEREEFDTKEKAQAQYDAWIGIMDEVEMVEL